MLRIKLTVPAAASRLPLNPRRLRVSTSKTIRLTGHAHAQLGFRGATEADVVAAIRTSPWQPAELGRLECRNDFAFNAEWNRRWYATRQVRPIFVDEPGETVLVTVYVYYF
jgi:hypothetical protein